MSLLLSIDGYWLRPWQFALCSTAEPAGANIALVDTCRFSFYSCRTDVCWLKNILTRSGLINPQYKDGSKCWGVQDSLQAYHIVFTGLKLSHLTLLAGFGCMKVSICPGRLNNLASPWFSCLNSLYLQIFYSGMSDILGLILPSAMLIHLHFQKCSPFTPTNLRTDTGLCDQKGGFSWRQENELVICAA